MSKYICLVEDNIDDWTLIDHALSQLKISVEVREFPNGMELLDAFVLYDIQDIPAGIILDINMPKLDGISTLKRLAKHPALYSVPAIVFSSFISDEEREQCLAAGALDVISKAMDFTGYKQQIETIAEKLSII